MTRNLEQVRAKHALAFWERVADGNREAEVLGEQGGDVVRGLSALIVNDGLLATIAFAKEKGKGHAAFMTEIGKFLACEERKVLPGKADDLKLFVKVLTDGDSQLLQQATAEALAYLAYLKRFRIKKTDTK